MTNSDVILLKRIIKAQGNAEKEIVTINRKIDHMERALTSK